MGKTKDSGLDGLLVIDKEAGWTSHDVVARVRGAIGQRRCGHSGTLDPDATGLLLIGFGRVTRLLPLLTALPKVYVGQIVLGSTTSTLDSSGEVTGSFAMAGVTLDEVRSATAPFVGDIAQIPPMVSAVQIGGHRLHELARQGIEIDRPPRRVHVERFDIRGWAEPGVLDIEVECGSGTYIRSLAADLGASLGGGAHLRSLRRTRIGSFGAESAILVGAADRSTVLLSASRALADYPRVEVDADVLGRVRVGMTVSSELLGLPETCPSGPFAVCAGEELVAVYEYTGESVARPVVVLAPR